MRTEDGHIISKCLNGEPEAFGFLVDRYKESVYAFAYSKLQNFHDAEDVTQEVFVKAFQKLRTLRRWDSFHAWIYSITTNICRNWIRNLSKRPDSKFIEDEDPQTLQTHSMDVYREELVLESVQETLHSLPEIHCQVLTLFYLGGMSTKEIAKFLGTSPNTIIQRLYRARSQLKEEMLDMLETAFEERTLPVGFTLRIVETVKRIRINPFSQTKGLPWGFSFATGIILAILGINANLGLFNISEVPLNSSLSAQTKVQNIGEFPVKALSTSKVIALSGMNGDDGGVDLSSQQNSTLMAPKGEGGKIPDKPSAHLGKGWLDALTYSPDGKILAVSTGLGTRLYDADNFNEIGILQEDKSSYCLAFSPDGKILAIVDDDKINLWDFQARKMIGSLQLGNSIAFSPDGKILAVSGVWQDNVIRLWDVQKQELIGILKGHTDYIYTVAFSSDGKTLASGGSDKSIRLWDIKEQKQIGLLNHKNTVGFVAISPDGKILASGDAEGELLLWNIQEQKQIGSLEGQKSWVYSLSFSPDGTTLVSGCYGEQEIRIWDVQTQKQIGSLQGDSDWNLVAFNPNGKNIATTGAQAIRFWDIQEQKQIAIIDGFVRSSASLAFSPDGKMLASAEGWKVVRLWDMQEQKSLGRLEGNSGWVAGLNSIAFSPDGKIIASINDKEIYLFDVQKQERIGILKGHSGAISSIAFTPDGKILVSSGNQNDQTVRVWDVAKQKELAVLNNGSWVHTVVISPDGETIAAAVGSEALIRLWDTKTRKEIGVLNDPATAAFSVAFSPDGKTLASCNQLGIIRIWNYKEQKLVDEFQGPKAQGPPNVVIIIFSPDGKWLVSFYSGNIQFWDVQEQKEIATTQEQFHKANAVAFSPNGKWMAIAGWDGTIQLWEVDIPVQGKAVNPMGKAIGTWGEVKKTQLFQNYPNPFNPETWIPFSLSKPEYLRIKIFNSSGKLVRTLELGYKEPGSYTNREEAAYWDGRNDNGELVASDAYFIVMEVGDFHDMKKMVMIK